MKLIMAQSTKPHYFKRFRVINMMNLRKIISTFSARLFFNFSTLNIYVSIRSCSHFNSLCWRKWMSFTPITHIGIMTWRTITLIDGCFIRTLGAFHNYNINKCLCEIK